jgi:hypothetical protein
MTFTFRPAVRESVGLLIGFAGPSGGGKTFSALRLARGIAGDKPFAVIDTEAGRAKHYADQFRFDHGDLKPPFRPMAYAEAIKAADDAGYPAIVVDSFSHEHAGEGGLLDWHEEEYQRLGGRDQVKMTAWIKPKMAHRQMVQRLLQVRAHLILCFRAEEKVDIVTVTENGQRKTKIVPKHTLSGFTGWVPICEKGLPFELTASFMLMPDRPGYPVPIKLQEQHKALFPLDRPITEESGRGLAEWAKGGVSPREVTPPPKPVAPIEIVDRAVLIGKIKAASDKLGQSESAKAIKRNLAKEHLQGAAMEKADVAALQDLLDALRARVTSDQPSLT